MELDDRWILDLRGQVVTVLGGSDARNRTIQLEGGVRISLRGTPSITVGSITAPGNRGRTPDIPSGLALIAGAKVLSVVVFKSGALRMVFDNGVHLNFSTRAGDDEAGIVSPDGLTWKIAKNAARVVSGP
jgi:hypothetical protein